MSKWIAEKLVEILGFEDEIVTNLVINVVQTKNFDPKKLQMDITGFLEKKASPFVAELWTLLLDASSQPTGEEGGAERGKRIITHSIAQFIIHISSNCVAMN